MAEGTPKLIDGSEDIAGIYIKYMALVVRVQ
jgi:hypothetical protein